MKNTMEATPKTITVAMSLALVAILLGFVLGGFFGLAESSVKQHLSDSGSEVLESVYGGDIAKKDAVVSKSFEYLKRAHMHGGAIGSVALGSILALIMLCSLGPVEKLSALSLGAGAILYSGFWLLAGLSAPGLGSTGAAKEALSFVAIPGAGLCILGVCGTLYSVLKTGFSKATT